MTENEQVPEGEVFRFMRGEEVRIYSLRVVKGGAELWRITIRPGQPDAAIKEEDFTDAEAAAQYFDEIARMMMAGKWRKISEFQIG